MTAEEDQTVADGGSVQQDGPTGSRCEAARTSRTSVSGSESVDAIWLEHLRWMHEDERRRLESAMQQRMALVGFTGVMLAILLPWTRELADAARWLAFVSILCLAVAFALLAWSSRGVGSQASEPGLHRARLVEHAPGVADGDTPGRVTRFLLNELLQTTEGGVPLTTSLRAVGQSRSKLQGPALGCLVAGVALSVIAAFVSMF